MINNKTSFTFTNCGKASAVSFFGNSDIMNQVTVEHPPPLPPKTRRSPPESTVLSSSVQEEEDAVDVFNYNHHPQSHVVKIHINPENKLKCDTQSVMCEVTPCITISINSNNPDMIQNSQEPSTTPNPYFYYGPFNCGVMSSGQISPSDTLDSGTCSDLDATPPPLPKKQNSGVSLTLIGAQNRRPSSTSSGAEIDSDDNESSISCDSLNNREIQALINKNNLTAPVIKSGQPKVESSSNLKGNTILPENLLQDIRERSGKFDKFDKIKEETKITPVIVNNNNNNNKNIVNNTNSFSEIICANKKDDYRNETDMYYDFHLNERVNNSVNTATIIEETFAGYKDLLGDGASTIRSAKGTVRGVKNRVRAGIATFLQINSSIKAYKEKDAGKVVIYTTTMGILRDTYQACTKVKQILRTLLIKFEERDVFMSNEYQAEIKDRMHCDHILVPQVFVDGQHIGDAETIERLNETGELRRMLKPYKSMDSCTPCKVCGGFGILPCPVCNGSKKSVHRNHFTAEFVALKCMNCDEVGLVRCSHCNS